MFFELLLLSGWVPLNQESLILICDQILIVESLVMSFLHLHLLSTLCHFDVQCEVGRDKLAWGDAVIDVAAESRWSVGNRRHCCIYIWSNFSWTVRGLVVVVWITLVKSWCLLVYINYLSLQGLVVDVLSSFKWFLDCNLPEEAAFKFKTMKFFGRNFGDSISVIISNGSSLSIL